MTLKETEKNSQALADLIIKDTALQRRGAYYSVTFAMIIDDTRTDISIENGQLAGVDVNPVKDQTNVDFSFTTDQHSWNQFCEPEPAPGFHDISAMLEFRYVQLSGNYLPWISNMMYVKGVIDHWKVWRTGEDNAAGDSADE
jgi:hypothetical protein